MSDDIQAAVVLVLENFGASRSDIFTLKEYGVSYEDILYFMNKNIPLGFIVTLLEKGLEYEYIKENILETQNYSNSEKNYNINSSRVGESDRVKFIKRILEKLSGWFGGGVDYIIEIIFD